MEAPVLKKSAKWQEIDDLWKTTEFSDNRISAVIIGKEQYNETATSAARVQMWWPTGEPAAAQRKKEPSFLSLTHTEQAVKETEGNQPGHSPKGACISSDIMKGAVACVHSHPNSSHYDASVCCGPAAPANVTCLEWGLWKMYHPPVWAMHHYSWSWKRNVRNGQEKQMLKCRQLGNSISPPHHLLQMSFIPDRIQFSNSAIFQRVLFEHFNNYCLSLLDFSVDWMIFIFADSGTSRLYCV